MEKAMVNITCSNKLIQVIKKNNLNQLKIIKYKVKKQENITS